MLSLFCNTQPDFAQGRLFDLLTNYIIGISESLRLFRFGYAQGYDYSTIPIAIKGSKTNSNDFTYIKIILKNI